MEVGTDNEEGGWLAFFTLIQPLVRHPILPSTTHAGPGVPRVVLYSDPVGLEVVESQEETI